MRWVSSISTKAKLKNLNLTFCRNEEIAIIFWVKKYDFVKTTSFFKQLDYL